MEKRKLEADNKLIKVLFNFDPLDWCRRDNGELVVINPIGQKFVYSPEEISKLSDKALAAKEAAKPLSVPQDRNAKIPEGARTKGKAETKPAPLHKSVHPKVKPGA